MCWQKGIPAEAIEAKLAGTAVNSANEEALAARYQASASDRQIGIKVVLSRNYIIGSIMLWIAFFMGLILFY